MASSCMSLRPLPAVTDVRGAAQGLEDPKPLYQAVPDGLRERTFEPVAALRVSHYPRKAKGLGGIPSAIDGVATSLLGGTASSDSCSSPHLGSRTGILARTGSSTIGAVRSVFGSLYPQQQAHLHVVCLPVLAVCQLCVCRIKNACFSCHFCIRCVVACARSVSERVCQSQTSCSCYHFGM